MSHLGGSPILVLREGTEREGGKSSKTALRKNIMAATALSESVRSALGPRGMDKMLVDGFGDVTITNDGATILKEMDVQHPVAKFLVELAKTQDQEAGDGTTSVVIIAGELLKQALKLVDDDVHPTILVQGYRDAADKATQYLEKIALDVKQEQNEYVRKAAITAMSSKIISTVGDHFADIVVKAVNSVVVDGKVGLNNIKVEKKQGEGLENTKIIQGIILDKSIIHPGMPRKMENAKIALIAEAIEISKTEIDAEVTISDPSQIKAFLDRETEMIKGMVDKILASGANVVLTSKGVDDIAQHLMSKAGVIAVRRIKKSDMEALEKATGAKVVNTINDLSADDLGTAGLISERKVGDDDWVFIEDCKNPKAVTILVRGGTELVVDEAERALHDALCVAKNVVEDPRVVYGGGATEMAISNHLRKYAESLSGREQLAVLAFAESIEIIPLTLAENTGLDPIDIMVALKQKHTTDNTYGVDPIGKGVKSFVGTDIVEPIIVKKQAILSAAEAAQMILRIDDVISTKGGGGGPPGGGMPPGMDM